MARKRTHESAAGPSQRQLRVGEQVRRTLSDLLNRGEIHDPDLNRLSLTVGEVRMSPDLRIATAWVLPLGGGERETAIELLAQNKSELRRALSRHLTLKFAPDLRFRIDETFDALDRTREMFADETVQRDIAAPDGNADE